MKLKSAIFSSHILRSILIKIVRKVMLHSMNFLKKNGFRTPSMKLSQMIITFWQCSEFSREGLFWIVTDHQKAWLSYYMVRLILQIRGWFKTPQTRSHWDYFRKGMMSGLVTPEGANILVVIYLRHLRMTIFTIMVLMNLVSMISPRRSITLWTSQKLMIWW